MSACDKTCAMYTLQTETDTSILCSDVMDTLIEVIDTFEALTVHRFDKSI